MNHWLRELRHAMRKLARTPAFSGISILTLALGIGATTAIFTVVNAVMLRPLPYADADRLVGLWHAAPGIGMAQIEQSDGTYLLYRAEAKSFDGLGVYQQGAVNLTSPDGSSEPERVSSASVTAGLLPVLGVHPLVGRWLAEGEDRPGAPPMAMISEALWRRKFGADPKVVGRTIQIEGTSREIIGVMPERFAFPRASTEVWLPLVIDPAHANAYSFNYDAVARLKPGVSAEDARRDLQRAIPLLFERFPVTFVSREMFDGLRLTAMVHPLRDDVVGDIGRILWVVLGTAGAVLLIACANVANLFLVRAEGRQKEVAVRSALGASARDLLRLALAEGVLLAAAGGVLGVLLAWLGTSALVAAAPFSLPRLGEISVDARVLGVAALVTLLAGLLFSVIPLLRYRAMSLASVLKEGGRGSTTGRDRHRVRGALVVSQVALALVLLAGAGLMARSFAQLRSVDPGFDPSHVLTLRIALTDASYREGDKRARFYSQLVERVRGVPGVRAVGAISKLPLLDDGHSNSAVWIENVPMNGGLPPVHELSTVTDGWFQSMGIPLREGRDFEPAERERGTASVIVSEALARHYWKNESALGKRMRPLPTAPWYTVVGVVGNAHGAGLEKPAEEMIYYPLVPAPGDTSNGVRYNMSLAVRVAGEPRGAIDAVRREVRALDPGLPVFNVRPLEEVVSASTARTSFTLVLLGIASVVALVLGAVGIYGVISYTVSLRTREIGVRMALGARAGDVGRMVTGQGVRLALAGVVLGLGGAVALTRALRTLLFGVAPGDPLTLAAAALGLLAISALASALPALRAARVHPMEALRGGE